jgi:hypothetical protein
LDKLGVVTYASPNARSAINRAGWDQELENHNLGDVIESLSRDEGRPTEESWRAIVSGKSVRREEFENDRGIFDILVMPLIQGSSGIGSIVLLHNVTELRRRDRALLTKDATIREIHHRVKNNLQTVSALLRLQSRRVDDPNAVAALGEAVRRVASIAIVHETLSTSTTETVAFDEVFSRIVTNAVELSPRPITVNVEGSFGTFDPLVATPLSLVITELIHNALEHGLADVGDELRVRVERDGQSCTVVVSDNGVGLPSDFNWETSSNLGLQIVKTLTENELKGSISLGRHANLTEAVLHF